MRLPWPEWLEVLDEMSRIWPQTRTGILARDYGDNYVEMDTLRAWHRLLFDFPAEVVYGALFRYAETDPRNEWPPNGPTLARIAREISIEVFAESQRRALPSPDDSGSPVGARTFSERQGFPDFASYRRARCRSQRHYDAGTDDTCRICHGLPPAYMDMAAAFASVED